MLRGWESTDRTYFHTAQKIRSTCVVDRIFQFVLISSSFHQTITYRTKDTNQNIISPVNIMISGFPVTIILTRYLEKNPAIRTIDRRFLIPRISYSRYSTAQAAIYFQIYRNAARYCPFIYTPLYTAYSTSRYPRTASPIAKISVIISIIPDCTLPCKNIQKSKNKITNEPIKIFNAVLILSRSTDSPHTSTAVIMVRII